MLMRFWVVRAHCPSKFVECGSIFGLLVTIPRYRNAARCFFVKMADTDNCLNYLLPASVTVEVFRVQKNILCYVQKIIHSIRIVKLSMID